MMVSNGAFPTAQAAFEQRFYVTPKPFTAKSSLMKIPYSPAATCDRLSNRLEILDLYNTQYTYLWLYYQKYFEDNFLA